MDGSMRSTLIADGLELPNGLTFDYYRRELCWADAGMYYISKVIKKCPTCYTPVGQRGPHIRSGNSQHI